MFRRKAKVDANQKEIVDSLRKMGASVQSLAPIGGGCPDLLVGWQGKNYLFEVKDGKKCPSKRTLSEFEREWHNRWTGQVHVIESLSDLPWLSRQPEFVSS